MGFPGASLLDGNWVSLVFDLWGVFMSLTQVLSTVLGVVTSGAVGGVRLVGHFLAEGRLGMGEGRVVCVIVNVTIVLSLCFVFAQRGGPMTRAPVISIVPTDRRGMRVFNRCMKHVHTRRFMRMHTHMRNFLRRVLFRRKASIGHGRMLFIVGRSRCHTGTSGMHTRLGGSRTRTRGTGHSLRHVHPLCRRGTTDRLSLSGTITTCRATMTDMNVDRTSLRRTRRRLNCAVIHSPVSKRVDRHRISLKALMNDGKGSLLTAVMGDSAVLISFDVATLSCLGDGRQGIAFNRGSSAHS